MPGVQFMPNYWAGFQGAIDPLMGAIGHRISPAGRMERKIQFQPESLFNAMTMNWDTYARRMTKDYDVYYNPGEALDFWFTKKGQPAPEGFKKATLGMATPWPATAIAAARRRQEEQAATAPTGAAAAPVGPATAPQPGIGDIGLSGGPGTPFRGMGIPQQPPQVGGQPMPGMGVPGGQMGIGAPPQRNLFADQLIQSLMMPGQREMLGFRGGVPGFQRGGQVPPKNPALRNLTELLGLERGESPAVLHEGEVVLRREAVDSLGGPENTDRLNRAFDQAPRYQGGGPAPLSGGWETTPTPWPPPVPQAPPSPEAFLEKLGPRSAPPRQLSDEEIANIDRGLMGPPQARQPGAADIARFPGGPPTKEEKAALINFMNDYMGKSWPLGGQGHVMVNEWIDRLPNVGEFATDNILAQKLAEMRAGAKPPVPPDEVVEAAPVPFPPKGDALPVDVFPVPGGVTPAPLGRPDVFINAPGQPMSIDWQNILQQDPATAMSILQEYANAQIQPLSVRGASVLDPRAGARQQSMLPPSQRAFGELTGQYATGMGAIGVDLNNQIATMNIEVAKATKDDKIRIAGLEANKLLAEINALKATAPPTDPAAQQQRWAKYMSDLRGAVALEMDMATSDLLGRQKVGATRSAYTLLIQLQMSINPLMLFWTDEQVLEEAAKKIRGGKVTESYITPEDIANIKASVRAEMQASGRLPPGGKGAWTEEVR